jgi:hypothetical protein
MEYDADTTIIFIVLEEKLGGHIPFGEAKTFAALSCVKMIDLEEVGAVLIKMFETVKGKANTIRVVVRKSSANINHGEVSNLMLTVFAALPTSAFPYRFTSVGRQVRQTPSLSIF